MPAIALLIAIALAGPAAGPASAVPPSEVSAAARTAPAFAGGRLCQARPGRSGWSWRHIEGRRCWYPGRRSIPKPALHWPPAATPRAPEPMPLPPPRPRQAPAARMVAAAAPLAFLLPSEMPTAPAPGPDRGSREAEDAEPPLAMLWPDLDAPLPVWRVKTISYRAPPPAPKKPPPPRPGPAWLTLILWGLGLGSAALAIAAAGTGRCQYPAARAGGELRRS